MSRVGKKNILIPEKVEVKIDGFNVIAKGPKGELTQEVRPEMKVEITGNEISIAPKEEFLQGKVSARQRKQINAWWGLTRALVANTIKGVFEGFEKKLDVQGIGFKAAVEGDSLVLNVGFSHPVKVKIPQGITVSVDKNIITIAGIDKGSVGQLAAVVRKVKPPEPYKGKGIRYLGEVVRKKVGKKAATAGA